MTGRALVVLAAALAAGCSRENARVRDARDAFYSAIANYDHGALRGVVLPGFLAVDRGRIFGLDSVASDVTRLEQDSMTVQYTFLDSAVRVEPPVALAVYRARRIVTRAPAFADTAYTLESATFRGQGSGWKLLMIHRTPINGEVFGDTLREPPPAPPPPPSNPTPQRPARAAPAAQPVAPLTPGADAAPGP